MPAVLHGMKLSGMPFATSIAAPRASGEKLELPLVERV
jgi:hypothetical protein